MPELASPPRRIMQSGSVDVDVQYGHYVLQAGGERSGADTPSRDGLLFGEVGWLAVVCCSDFVPVPCRVEVLRRMPPAVDRGWDMVTEHDLDLRHGVLTVMGSQGHHPHLTLSSTPGAHRVRVHVRNREQGLQIADADPTVDISPVNPEEHLLQLWPAAHARPAETLLGPDRYAVSYLSGSA
ncbi:hypothetical protein ACIQVK_19665 [Streptomyces sp. NPDC090493]|uniref:hypothetical protein n=1 Tax=Streptomyces sp. NPDC090493 TaxID=3365964 RepID=UPI003819CB05